MSENTQKLDELLKDEFGDEFEDEGTEAPITEVEDEASDEVSEATERSFTASDEDFHVDQLPFDLDGDQ